MNSVAIEAVRERLFADTEERLFGSGGQVYVSVAGQPVLDFTLGEDATGAPVDEHTLFAVYCAAKPVVALGVARLLVDGELSLDDEIGDILAELHGPISRTRVGHLLNHTSGLHELSSSTFVARGDEGGEELVFSMVPPIGWRPGHDVAYSEIAAWYLVQRIIETLVEDSMRSFLRASVLAPLGLEQDLFVGGMGQDDFLANRHRLGTNLWISGGSEFPMLIERTRRFRSMTNVTLGSSANARSLGRLYEAVQDMLGSGSEVLPADLVSEFTSRQSAGFDQAMQRTCSYGYGFMVELGDHYFGNHCSASTFGHSGNGGMTAAFCDPDHDLVVAFHFNGRTDAESAVTFRRPVLVDSIYRAVIGS